MSRPLCDSGSIADIVRLLSARVEGKRPHYANTKIYRPHNKVFHYHADGRRRGSAAARQQAARLAIFRMGRLFTFSLLLLGKLDPGLSHFK